MSIEQISIAILLYYPYQANNQFMLELLGIIHYTFYLTKLQ